jgi:hypothetical protein
MADVEAGRLPSVVFSVKRLPNSVFSTSDQGLEIRIAALPNSMLPFVDSSLDRLARAFGISLITAEDKAR